MPARSSGRSAFLSTLPARGATGFPSAPTADGRISIHAPREGSDTSTAACVSLQDMLFLSTLPARGATCCRLASQVPLQDFYPRSPRGERRSANACRIWLMVFLSTLPARGATLTIAGSQRFWSLFLSTLPARGATMDSPSTWYEFTDFYPRSPRGERHCALCTINVSRDFYPRSPRGERRRCCRQTYSCS